MAKPIVQMRPNRCRYCDVGYAALKYTLDEATQKGYDVIDLAGDLATREKLEQVISDKKPIFFHAFGHGNKDVFTGQDTKIVLRVGVNEEVCAGMIVYLLSCLTGIELGPAIIKAGGWAYLGYIVSWTWMDEDGKGDPYEDHYAEGFYKGSNAIPFAFLKGLTAREAYAESYAEYSKWIDYWAASGDPYASECVHWLTHDRDNCVLLGDETARISPLKKYRFKEWENGSTIPSRTVNVQSDMKITAYYKEVSEVGKVTFKGSVSAQAAAGETVTITVTLPDATTEKVVTQTLEDRTFSIGYENIPGNYKAKARIEADELYEAAESDEVPFSISKEPRTITLTVV